MKFYVVLVGAGLIACGVAYALPTGGADGGAATSNDASSEPLQYWLAPGEYAWGDFNFDGHVDRGDFLIFQACFNGPDRPSRDPSVDADWDRDGDVDRVDFLAFQAAFGGPTAAPRFVGTRPGTPGGENPEPLSLVLVAAAVGGLAWERRRRANRPRT